MNGDWRQLHNEELHSLFLIYCSQGDEMYKIKMGRACIQNRRQECFQYVKKINLQVRDLYEGLRVDGSIMLEWILKKWVSVQKTVLIWLWIGIIGEPL